MGAFLRIIGGYQRRIRRSTLPTEVNEDSLGVRRQVIKTGQRGDAMSATIINLIIQIIAGAIGGNAAGAGMEKANLGTAGNTIAGALGGLGGGQILSALIPAIAGAAGGADLKSIVGQLVGGGVGGAILTIIVGLIKDAMAKS
jgi:hypothetical protein